jgi:hypothetical protein
MINNGFYICSIPATETDGLKFPNISKEELITILRITGILRCAKK